MRNKTNITLKQINFVEAILEGKTQREAYYTAYPNSKKWKPGAVDTTASGLYNKPEIQKRIAIRTEELAAIMRAKGTWSREQSVKKLQYVIDICEKEVQRIEGAYNEELDILLKGVAEAEDPKQAASMLLTILKEKKQRRISKIHTGSIIEAVAELNKMHGFTEENINLNGTVVFSGEEEMKE